MKKHLSEKLNTLILKVHLKQNLLKKLQVYFNKKNSSIIDNHAPVKLFQTRKNYAPWIGKETKSLIKERNELKQESMNSNDPEKLSEYKRIRNKIKSRIKNEKQSYYQERFEKAKNDNDSKQMWNNAYEILGSKNNLSPTQLLIDGNLCSNPQK